MTIRPRSTIGRGLARLVGAALLLLGTARATPPETDPAPPGDADRGAALAELAGCAACHTAEGGVPYAGGHRVETPFGTFVGSNLTPHPEQGLGAWTYRDFERAMRRGRSPEGRPYWPAFPYTSFTGLTDQDLADLWAHLQTLEADPQGVPPHRTARGRWQAGLWRLLAFHPRGPFRPDPDRSQAWNRGAYLGRHVAHCGECHTPRGAIGGLKRGRELGGSDLEPEPGPNLTPHPDALGDWSREDWRTFLTLGMTAEGDFVGGEMARVTEATAALPEADREALITWLMDLEPVRPR
jgi:mono/diheme cytochrome c family protein